MVEGASGTNDHEQVRFTRLARSMAQFLPNFRGDVSNPDFLAESLAANGDIAADRLRTLLHITSAELAVTLGLSRDAVSKRARLSRPATQTRLRDMVEILNRVRPWAGSPQQAFAWYRSQPIAAFGDQTAEALVREGRADSVRRYLDRIAVGGYA